MGGKKLEKTSLEIAQSAAAYLREIGRLMELKGENPFKVKAFSKAADNIEDTKDLKPRALAKTLGEIPGVGKTIEEILTDFILHDRTTARDEIKNTIPEGLLELTQIPGVGPKKALVLIEELGIKTLGELEYACRENRLQSLKGFGEKVQAKILSDIQFWKSNQGQVLLPSAIKLSQSILTQAQEMFSGHSDHSVTWVEVGEVRRRLPIVKKLSYLAVVEKKPSDSDQSKIKKEIQTIAKDLDCVLEIEIDFCRPEERGWFEVKTSSSAEHWKAIQSPSSEKAKQASSEEIFYKSLGLPLIPAEMREDGREVGMAKKSSLQKILPEGGLQGVFHNHTHYSDGVNTIEEMVSEARTLGLKYIGISDHSQSAFYAQGLKLDALKKQEKEINQVREKFPEIRIFWGVESDILADGELDYESSVLKRFDFVVASIHSRFKMDRKTMTDRILKAIRNPFTTMVGHLTGRLLLGRPPYELDIEKVIEVASKEGVAIELNSHPQRLDVDWHWGPQLRENKTWVCINPDAHEVAGLSDTRYGVWMARKALLPSSQIVNTKSVREVESWLKSRD